ncbi:MAG: lactonase family protein [Pseudoxanthomonas sp.]
MALVPLAPLHAGAAQYDLLVGSYTKTPEQGIYVYRFDGDRGRLQAAPARTVATGNPSWLAVSPDGRHVYSVNEFGDGDPDPVGRVSHLARDGQGRLTLLQSRSTLGDHPAHAALSPDGRYLFVSNYSVGADPGGTLAVLPLDADGGIGPVVQIHSYQASGHDRERQASAHVHSATMAPDGRHLLVADLGGDRIYVYRYDPQANAERPLQPADPAWVELPPGSGPRHVAFSVDGRHAYATLEMSAQVAVLDYADGRLRLRGVRDLTEPGFAGSNGASALHLSADGRFLYAANRGSDNRIAVFAVGADGDLQLLQRRSTEGEGPREFALSPDGRHLLVGDQGSDRIVVIARDPRSGRLGRTLQRIALPMPSDLKFVEPR